MLDRISASACPTDFHLLLGGHICIFIDKRWSCPVTSFAFTFTGGRPHRGIFWSWSPSSVAFAVHRCLSGGIDRVRRANGYPGNGPIFFCCLFSANMADTAAASSSSVLGFIVSRAGGADAAVASLLRSFRLWNRPLTPPAAESSSSDPARSAQREDSSASSGAAAPPVDSADIDACKGADAAGVASPVDIDAEAADMCGTSSTLPPNM